MPVLLQQCADIAKASDAPFDDYSVCFVDLSPKQDTINGVPCISENEFIALEADRYFNVAVGDGRLREKIVAKVENHARPISIVARTAEMLAENSVHESAILSPQSMITSNATIGRYFQLNIYSYVAHDCVIGDYVTFAPKVCCNGNVIVEDLAYVGTGAILKQGTPEKPLVIGAGAVVGMGAVVTKDVPAGDVVVGNPARSMKSR